MIISHKYRFIFVATPKTGTHAVRFALREFLGQNDLEQVGLFVKKRFPFKETAHIRHGHIKCKEINYVLGEETWKNYFKFAFVRNPWDRYISYCFFMYRNSLDFYNDPRKYFSRIIDDPTSYKRVHFIPQTEFINDDAGNPLVDYVGRYENLQGAYDYVCKQVGIPALPLVRINGSKHLPYPEYYDEELKLKVQQVYQSDIDQFNYRFN